MPRPFAPHRRSLPRTREAVRGGGRLSRGAQAPETAPGESPAAALGAPGARSEAAAQAARARGFSGARGGTWRASGRSELCRGTSSIYSRLATHVHARPPARTVSLPLSLSLSHTQAGARSEPRCPLRSAPLRPPLLLLRQARPPRFPRAEVRAQPRRPAAPSADGSWSGRSRCAMSRCAKRRVPRSGRARLEVLFLGGDLWPPL